MAEYKKTPIMPIIFLMGTLVVLILMVLIRMRSAPDEVTMLATVQAKAVEIVASNGPEILINGKHVSDYAAPKAKVLAYEDPRRWQLAQVARIDRIGSRIVLVFTDGSSREVSPTLIKQLPGELQVRVSYAR